MVAAIPMAIAAISSSATAASVAAGASAIGSAAMTAAPFVAAGGSILSGVQGMQAGKAQAKIAMQQSELEKRSAADAASSESDRARRYRAAQIARFGASGVTMTGTPTNVFEQTAFQQEKDILAIKYGGDLRSRRALGEAEMAKSQARSSLIGGFTGAGSSMIRGLR
jgi:hypothetical protein